MITQQSSPTATQHIEEICVSLSLDLRGARVITEAATGAFAYTAAIAAQAGARVTAIAADSRFGTAAEAAHQTSHAAREIGVEERVHIADRSVAQFELADIVTNLGSVRPLTADLVSRMTPGSVIPIMYDARELREKDIDVSACSKRGIRVVGTYEEHPRYNIFRHIGPLALQLIRDTSDMSPASCVGLIGSDLFCNYLLSSLRDSFRKTIHVPDWESLAADDVAACDLFLFSDYCGDMSMTDSVINNKALSADGKKKMLQFTGGSPYQLLCKNGWRIVPQHPIEKRRMFHTLAYLGVEPVIELHACGLKAAEIVWKSLDRKSAGDLIDLCQIMC